MSRGQFGIVRRATLRRRNKLPAQYVAVKELLRGDAIELVEEAKKMLEVPNHPNVVRFLGKTRHSTGCYVLSACIIRCM